MGHQCSQWSCQSPSAPRNPFPTWFTGLLCLLLTTSFLSSHAQSFSLVSGTPFVGVAVSSIAFADVDGDGDKDVLITGQSEPNTPLAQLYTNNGSGVFTLVAGTPFVGVNFSSIAFADVDKDGDQDVLITGQSAQSMYLAQLYTNNGSGLFTLVNNTPFIGVAAGSIGFADVDKEAIKMCLLPAIAWPICTPMTGWGTSPWWLERPL